MMVSIITLVFNNKDLIKGCINSITSQTYKNIEYIIINRGSTDEILLKRLETLK